MEQYGNGPQQPSPAQQHFQASKVLQQSALGLGYPRSPGGAQTASPLNAKAYPQHPQSQSPVHAFMSALQAHLAPKGTHIVAPLVVDGKQVDFFRLFQLVTSAGGFAKVHQSGYWRQILTSLGFPTETGGHADQRMNAIALAYHTWLYSFEITVMTEQAARAAATLPNPPQPNTASPYNQQQSPPIQYAQPQQLNRTAQSQAGSPRSQASPRQVPAAIPGQQVDPTRAPTPSQQQQQQQQRWNQMPPPSTMRAGSPEQDQKGKGRLNESISYESRRTPLPTELSGPYDGRNQPSTSTSSPSAPFSHLPSSSKLPMNPSIMPHNPFDSNSATSQSAYNVELIRQQQAHQQHMQQQNAAESSKRPREPISVAPRTLAERKRNKIEYVPLVRSMERHGGWDLRSTEVTIAQAIESRKPRHSDDLGVVDIHSLTMALKSRLGSEVAFALNSLTLISLNVQSARDMPGIQYDLGSSPDLLEELVELYEESAFGLEEEASYAESDTSKEEEVVIEEATTKEQEDSSTYRKMFRIAVEEELELQIKPPPPTAPPPAPSTVRDGSCPLVSIDLVLAISNLLRNFSANKISASAMASHPRLLPVVLRIAELELSRGDSTRTGSKKAPLRVSALNSLALKKDALELVTNMGTDIKLVKQDDSTAASLFRLLLFFLYDPHQEELQFDISAFPSLAQRIPQQSNARHPYYLDLGLNAFARIAVADDNRAVFARVAEVDLCDVFQSLLYLLPVTESQFQIAATEGGLLFLENLSLCLYNLAFLSPAAVKLRLRVMPSVIRGLLRVIRRLTSTSKSPDQSQFTILCDRCALTIGLLSEVGGITDEPQEVGGEGPWYGLGMYGEDDGRQVDCLTSGAAHGSIKVPRPKLSRDSIACPVFVGMESEIMELIDTPHFGLLSALLGEVSKSRGTIIAEK